MRIIMATSTIGSSSEFHHESEKTGEYLECVKLYFEVYGIKEKQVAVLLTVIGSVTYALLSSLVAPAKPCDKTFKQLVDILRQHFDPKPLINAECFHFTNMTKDLEKPLVNT